MSLWTRETDETPSSVVGCVLSNELIDAFPIHRFEVTTAGLAELFVDVDSEGKFYSVVGEPSTPLLAQRLGRLGIELPEGTRGEINLGIGPWARRVSETIERGFVVTIDYGHESKELYSSKRSRGTLQTYYKHTSGSSPYQWIGRQDITAHVDFTTVIDEGRNVGLKPLSLMTQAEYLNRLGLKVWADRLRDRDISPRDVRANAAALRNLVDPDGLGGFKVLIQEKDTELEDVNRLFPSRGRVEQLPMPLLRSDHVPLFEGGYSSEMWNFEVSPKDE